MQVVRDKLSLLQKVGVSLLEAFDADSVELGIVDDLSALALIFEESQKLTPSDLFIITMIQLINQSLKALSVKVDLFFELAPEFNDWDSFNLSRSTGGRAFWFELGKQFLDLRQILPREIKRM